MRNIENPAIKTIILPEPILTDSEDIPAEKDETSMAETIDLPTSLAPDESALDLQPETDENIPAAEPIMRSADLAILPGLIDLPRHDKTAPIDGCSKINKGLVMGGGFMIFTCEKLLPFYPIDDHQSAYADYERQFKDTGWKKTRSQEPAPYKKSFKRMGDFGCETIVDMELWADRSMNEASPDTDDRNNHRQIVFKAWFQGEKCEAYYETAELLVTQ